MEAHKSQPFDGTRQEPNRSRDNPGNENGRAKHTPVAVSLLPQAIQKNRDKHERSQEYDDQPYSREDGCHVAPKSGQHAIDPALLKALATRANDYLLLSLIMVLGFIALCSIPALNRVEREFQIAARV